MSPCSCRLIGGHRSMLHRRSGSLRYLLTESLVGFSHPLPRARIRQRDEKQDRICGPATTPLRGEELLSAVTEAMVALHERYHRRTPATAEDPAARGRCARLRHGRRLHRRREDDDRAAAGDGRAGNAQRLPGGDAAAASSTRSSGSRAARSSPSSPTRARRPRHRDRAVRPSRRRLSARHHSGAR